MRTSVNGLWVGQDLAYTRTAKPPKKRQGGHRVNAKLTPEQVREIWELRERGWSCARIAQKLGMPPGRISSVIYCGSGTRTVLLNSSST